LKQHESEFDQELKETRNGNAEALTPFIRRRQYALGKLIGHGSDAITDERTLADIETAALCLARAARSIRMNRMHPSLLGELAMENSRNTQHEHRLTLV